MKKNKSLVLKIVFVLLISATATAEMLISKKIDNQILELIAYERTIENDFTSTAQKLRLADLIGLDKKTVDLILGTPLETINKEEWYVCYYYKTSLFFQNEGTLEIGFDNNVDMNNPLDAFYIRWTLNSSREIANHESIYRNVLLELTDIYGEPCSTEDDGYICYSEWLDTVYDPDLDNVTDINYEMQDAGIEDISLVYYRNGNQSDENSHDYCYIDLMIAQYIGW